MSKVVMLLSNPFRPDVRVHKEAKTLVDEGHEVVSLRVEPGGATLNSAQLDVCVDEPELVADGGVDGAHGLVLAWG